MAGKTSEKAAAAEKVKCPKCGAYAGMPCRAGSGYGEPHPVRVEKAAKV